MKLLLKAGAVGPQLVASTLLVTLVVGPALPEWARTCLFYGGLTATSLLMLGIGESHTVRVLCRARRLSQIERDAMASIIADLCHLGLGPPLIELFVARRPGTPAAIAHGRRSVVVAPELLHAIMTGQLPHREAVAVLAHASHVARAGLARQDLPILLWSAPWRILACATRPLRGLLGLSWKIRFLIFGVAIWQSLTTDRLVPGQTASSLHRMTIATALGCLLALTCLVPRWSNQWAEYVASTGDQELIADGLGPAMAAFLRRFPQTPPMIARVPVLDPPTPPPAPVRPLLRLVKA